MRRLDMDAHKFATSSEYTIEHKQHVSNIEHALCNNSKSELLPDALQARDYVQSSSNYAALA
jgi:hypothetical protein